jgi:hypothetical protein
MTWEQILQAGQVFGYPAIITFAMLFLAFRVGRWLGPRLDKFLDAHIASSQARDLTNERNAVTLATMAVELPKVCEARRVCALPNRPETQRLLVNGN